MMQVWMTWARGGPLAPDLPALNKVRRRSRCRLPTLRTEQPEQFEHNGVVSNPRRRRAAWADHRWHSWGVGRDSYYDILGVSSFAPPDEIRAKYRKLIQRIHPDLDGPAALFRQVQEAYEVLSDPARRATYDRALRNGAASPPPSSQKAEPQDTASPGSAGRSASGSGRSGATRAPSGSVRQAPSGQASRTAGARAGLRRHPARVVAMAGAVLLVLGAAATGPAGTVLLVLGTAALVLAGVAGLGGRGSKECEAYQRSGMAAIDAMTDRQFEALLEHLFANKGYRVARLRVGGDHGADLLLDLPHRRTIVQVKHWSGVVRHEAVHQVVVAKARYGVARALVVTSSNYSPDAVAVANSNGVTLWNRAALALELSAFRGDSLPSGAKRFSADVRAGSLMTLGSLATLLVALLAASARVRSRLAATRRRG